MAKHRPFVIAPAKIQDVRRLVDIEFHAFEYEQVNQVLSFRDYKKPAHFERTVQLYENALHVQATTSGEEVQDPCGQSDISFKKVVDTETGEIVSFAKVERKRYDVEEFRSSLDSGYENDPKMNRDWFALNERKRREYVGLRPHYYIGMLATEPQHQHHGAGTMLLEEILAEADDTGVEVYLEATDTAKPLYEKHGFEEVTELRFDPGRYGVKGLGTERQTVMVRGVLESEGDGRPVRSWENGVARTRKETQNLRGCSWLSEGWDTKS